MQAYSQGLWVLCAEIGVAWHILRAGDLDFRAVALSYRLLAVLLSVFFSQMQAHSQGLCVLCAEIDVA